MKRASEGGKSDEERSVGLLREFSTWTATQLRYWWATHRGTAGQKRLFKSFPEVVMIDTTHGT
ncbi:hypothetical protein JG687_00015904 [Phytophthora cactorum]|uniref:Uncharacterized protein n=1 Tax=Phytophthora cactorum TaxID=29920 RepID=A0A8T1TTP1_9STRA|nr:hypothetical protein GQ600_15784 [Phytophthora cactorum]KAG6947751.1 hypothetical protein JG687_00015904 [Phytophthora cactorum]